MQKICKHCGRLYEAKSPRSLYCNEPVTSHCAICGKEFQSYCNPSAPTVCSKSCASKSVKTKVCPICGDSFQPKSARQKYCRKPIQKICKQCGSIYMTYCGDTTSNTCSIECSNLYAHQKSTEAFHQTTRVCEWCGQMFHPINNTQKYCMHTHYQTCVVCGRQFEVNLHESLKPDIRKTCSDECAQALRFADGNPFQKPECREKAKQTYLQKYGVAHPMRSPEVTQRMYMRYKERTGYPHPSHNPEVRSKSAKSGKLSKFELRVAALFDEYHIEYIQHHMISQDDVSHEFDFYLPKYKFLIDCDGVYYHGYLSDPDGKHVLDYYDEDRLSLIPSDHMFHVIIEGQEEKDIKYIIDILKQIDSSIFDYAGELFKWCRSIEFPYPEYDEIRIKQDYAQLCKCHYDKYNPAAKLAISAINQFHRSIYDAHVNNYPSPKEAWYDDKLLKKVITNRLIYKNDVNPYKILQGFNISKICPRISIFNPVLARYLVEKYLSEYNTVFDPFSGYSGRLLGVASLNKTYIGQDLNELAVQESNQLAEFLGLSNYSVTCADTLDSCGSYPCLLTCPPYADKEHYSDESVIKTCDEWIDYILTAFTCNRYVFVVDHTDKYKEYVVETIKSTSHFNTVTEQIIVIDRDLLKA